MKFYLTALSKYDYVLRMVLNGATCFFADSFYVQQKSSSLMDAEKADSSWYEGVKSL